MMEVWAPEEREKCQRRELLLTRRDLRLLTERVDVKLDREADDLVEAHLDVRVLHVVLILGDLVSRTGEASASATKIRERV